MMPHAASHNVASSTVSSRAPASALNSACGSARFGVRKNGSLSVNRPFIVASPMVCDSARPASAAASVCRTLAPTRLVYRCTSFTILNANSDSGRIENIASGGSNCVGARIIAADQQQRRRR